MSEMTRRYSVLTKIFSDKFPELKANLSSEDQVYELNFREKNVHLYGDTFIKFKHVGAIMNTKMFRMAFNSNYIKSPEVTFEKTMLDPDTVVNDKAFPPNFKVKIVMQEVSAAVFNQEELKLQREGRDDMIRILREWEAENITPTDTQTLIFGDPDFDDREEMMVINFDDQMPADTSDNED